MSRSACDFNSLDSKFCFPYLNNMSKILYVTLFGIQQFAHNVTVRTMKRKIAFQLVYIEIRTARVGKLLKPLVFQKCGRIQRRY